MVDAEIAPRGDDVVHAVAQRIADRYTVQTLLGRGGMGAVYRVVDETTQRGSSLAFLHSRRLDAAYETQATSEWHA